MSATQPSASRLGRVREVMSGYVERGKVPGVVVLVSWRGATQVYAIGQKSFGSAEPMRRDTIFRISSMTKPVTAITTMILVEECKLRPIAWRSPDPPNLCVDFWTSAYQAIDD